VFRRSGARSIMDRGDTKPLQRPRSGDIVLEASPKKLNRCVPPK
jgi:hypothetical protein